MEDQFAGLLRLCVSRCGAGKNLTASSLADLVASGNGSRDLPMPPPEEAGSSIIDATPEFDVLIYVANWPERRNHAWKTLL